ncbi:MULTISPECIES: amino acid ABC transporter substrate-binding protein [Paraclostridium]|uniref:Amino acid ABC transporter substrate-binding protein n=1 Tax=Paraclostridium benzoelyticum TaxID=1629550 RepID=A0A0M3DCQ1_9FIRM|nr:MULTISPECIES: amino acid ABC transporter substrate-binding protein [Paraclostridium]KKX99905.1 amino acid ABC transporter substrate-binding protein [Paraclostridium benzoelyticum]MCU9816115.1 amino acid ABC transporter substrate-binding protein [Paraclostridium sp. AKS73]OXX83998.1 amino acid ABC transporter substrate-binding protein [Paraclostridium benzoelyticum]
MKNIIKVSGLFLLVFLAILSLTGCSKSNKNAQKHNENEVIVGYDNTFVPMGFLNDKGIPSGFDIDLAKEVFSRLNMNVKFQNIDWSMKDVELNSGNIDVLWNGYTLTDERRNKVDYSNPYLSNNQVIVTIKNSAIKSKADLKNKVVATQQGSSGLDILEKDNRLVNTFKNKAPILYDTFDNAFRDLESKRIDAVVVDEVLAKYYIANSKNDNFKISNDILGKEVFVVGFKKGNIKLRDKVNNVLDEIKQDKTFDKVYKKWFNQ